jgi:hypothetical protein
MGSYEYGLYTASLCVDALNLGVAGCSIWCLHQIRLIDEIYPEGDKMMRIGLWAYKDKNWQPFPIYYLYRLFTKYIKSSSKVLKTKTFPSNILKAACVEYKGKYSLFITNPTNMEQNFLVEWEGLDSYFRKYIYSKFQLSLAQENLLMIDGQVMVKNGLKDKIPASSVILYTNLKE